ncbi:MAG TPA: MFS transporter [Gemmatimonadales bacterium]|nr:MFS transporter [Gemmatimonadales bacterium]
MPALRHDPYAALRHADFRWFIIALTTMTVAVTMRGIVVGWQVYSVTHDPLSLGLIGLAEALPFIASALFAGHVADRTDRRRITMLAMVVLLACAGGLLALSGRGPLGRTDIRWFYLVIGVGGVARSFLMAARTALAAELVPREHYGNASAWRTSSWQFAAVAGPACGGVIYGLAGPVAAYGTDLALMVVAVLAIAQVRPRGRPPEADVREPLAQSLSGGIRFLRGQPVVLGAMTLDLFSVLFGGAVALLPVYAADILRVGPAGLGILRAAPAAGAVVTSLWLTHRPPFRRAGLAMLGNVATFGLSVIAFGISRNFALSALFLAIYGGVDVVSVVIRATLVQEFTPHAVMGRVSAVNSIFIGSSNEIGAFESGLAAKLMGTVPSVVFGGTVTLAVVALTAWRVPSLRRLREIKAPAASS